MINMKYYLLLIIIIVIFLYIKYILRRNHKFWDKQPVSRKIIKMEGIISKNPKFNIILDKNFKFSRIAINNNDKCKELFKFINKHFSKFYTYPNNFLTETLTYINKNKVYNIGLYDKIKLVGFIHAKPINLVIKNIELKTYYVDFLCVHKDYRGKNLATFLISKLINSLGKYQTFIFKKENSPLPFNYINKSLYYYMDVTFLKPRNITNMIEFINNKNIEKVYEFIKTVSKKSKVYSKFTLMEFLELYHKNTSKNILVEYNNKNEIIAVLSFVNLTFTNSSQPSKTADIENIYVNNIGEYQIFDYLVNYSKRQNIRIISCVDQFYNKYFIEKNKMFPSMKMYFHTYNYHINDVIDPYNICFNFL